jgi:NAD(P)-dependent dehydrogenase (short-subunit alcohol dehydrogenase family)
MEFKGKVSFITGAGQGIGKAAAGLLAKNGAIIAAADLNKAAADKTIKEIESLGGMGRSFSLDVSEEKQVNDVVSKIQKEFGKIDIFINAAGVVIPALIKDLTEETWDKTMNVNAKGTFLCCKAVAGSMVKKGSGKIINLSSRASKLGEAGQAAYCCSKAAVNLFTQVLALELAPYGICVNAICPSLVDTEMVQQAIDKLSRQKNMKPEEYRKTWTKEIPLRRMAKPEEVGELILFLAGNKSDYITGSAINIDGGTTRI